METSKLLPVEDGGPYSTCTRRQRRFVDEYIANGKTAAQAIRAIGYKGDNPTNAAWMMLKNPLVQDAIRERRKQLIDDVGVRQERVLTEMYAIATCDPRRIEDDEGRPIPLHKLDAATAAAISSVEIEDISSNGESGRRYKYKFHNKAPMLDKLGQFMKMWESNHTTNVNVDNRKVEVNASVNAGDSEALRRIDELVRTVKSLGAPKAATTFSEDGSVLPAEVCDVPNGRGTSMDDGTNQGGAS